jgi:hypothetical protein
METARRVQAIKNRLITLNDLAANLNQTIKHQKTKNYFLRPVRNKLSSVETELVPWALKASTPANASIFLNMAEFELGDVERRLNHVQEMVTAYGAGIQVIGG